MRARIYKIQRQGDGWYAYGVPVGRPRLRCTWEIDATEAAAVESRLSEQPIERNLGEPVRTVGVPDRFPPTDGY